MLPLTSAIIARLCEAEGELMNNKDKKLNNEMNIKDRTETRIY